jgi:hypothetical protein
VSIFYFHFPKPTDHKERGPVPSDQCAKLHANLNKHTRVRFTLFFFSNLLLPSSENPVNQVTMELGRKGIVLIFKIRNTMLWLKAMLTCYCKHQQSCHRQLCTDGAPTPGNVYTTQTYTLDPAATMENGTWRSFPRFYL